MASGLLFSRGMSRATVSLAGVAAVLLIGSPIAHADDSPEVETSSQAAPADSNAPLPNALGHHALAFNLGLGSAIGLLGATYSLAFGGS